MRKRMVAKLVKYKNREWCILLLQSQTYIFGDKSLSSYQRKKQLKERVNQVNNIRK